MPRVSVGARPDSRSLAPLGRHCEQNCTSKESPGIQSPLPWLSSHPLLLLPDPGPLHLNLKSTSLTLIQTLSGKALALVIYSLVAVEKIVCCFPWVTLHFQPHVVGAMVARSPPPRPPGPPPPGLPVWLSPSLGTALG